MAGEHKHKSKRIKNKLVNVVNSEFGFFTTSE